MLLTISTTHQPATDLGFLLHKNPDRHHVAEQSCIADPQPNAGAMPARRLHHQSPGLNRVVAARDPEFFVGAEMPQK